MKGSRGNICSGHFRPNWVAATCLVYLPADIPDRQLRANRQRPRLGLIWLIYRNETFEECERSLQWRLRPVLGRGTSCLLRRFVVRNASRAGRFTPLHPRLEAGQPGRAPDQGDHGPTRRNCAPSGRSASVRITIAPEIGGYIDLGQCSCPPRGAHSNTGSNLNAD
jgi:hypothetical protein